MIGKYQAVLDRPKHDKTNEKVVFRGDRDDHTLEYSIWQAMGHPETITITVEPGDKLNEEDS